MPNNEVASLINLLDDSDSEVVSIVMDKLCAKGEEVIPMLETAWRNSFEETQLTRLEHVIAQIQENTTLAKLKEWVEKGAPDTLTGVYYVNKLFRPDIDFNAITKQVKDICREVWIELHAQLTALEQVRLINYVIYESNKFTGKRLVDSDRLILLSDLLQHKEGSQISLGVLYKCVAEELNLAIDGLSLTQSAMLGYRNSHTPHTGKYEMLFFIDPYNGGLCSEEQLKRAIEKHINPQKPIEDYLRPCSIQSFVQRYAHFLAEMYGRADKALLHDKATRAAKILGKGIPKY